MAPGVVVATCRAGAHGFSKAVVPQIELVTGMGVADDAHAGETVRHRSRVRRDPTQPNLRQVHLIHAELLDELALRGFAIAPGDLGENVLTRGVDLLGLATGALLHIGTARIRVTGLRNPCAQIEAFRPGLLAAVLDRAADGALVRKCGVMGVVENGGTVRAGDGVAVVEPALPHRPLEPV